MPHKALEEAIPFKHIFFAFSPFARKIVKLEFELDGFNLRRLDALTN
jgi:hypothetical protein